MPNSDNNPEMEWANNGGSPKTDRCNSLFSCFDGQPGRVPGTSSFDFSPPRVVGSLGDSTLFGADSEAAAAAAAAAAPVLSMSDKYSAQFAEVQKLVKARGLFTDAAVDAHSLEYYNHLGLNEFYFQTANPAAIADNLIAVIAARALHSVSGADYFPEIRQVDEKTGDVFALARASLTNRKACQNYKVEQQFELEFLDMGLSGNKQQMRMQCYRSTGSVFGIDGDTERLRTYFFQKPKFPLKPEEVSDAGRDRALHDRARDLHTAHPMRLQMLTCRAIRTRGSAKSERETRNSGLARAALFCSFLYLLLGSC